MTDRKRFISLILIMTGVSLVVGGIAIALLYHAALDESRRRLVETAQSQARLIEAIARFDRVWNSEYPDGSMSATLQQVTDAHERYKGFGDTGEFTLAQRKKDNIVFLLSHRHADLDNPKPIPFESKLAEPMRRALLGQSGSMIGLDYRGIGVVAAHEPVAELGLGIVAKIDIAEVRAPFIKAGLYAMGSALSVILFSTALFLRISNPILKRLQSTNEQLERRVRERTAELEAATERLQKEIEERKHTEASLATSVREWQDTFDASNDAVCLLDVNRRILRCNRAMKTLTGGNTAEILDRPCYEVVHGTDRPGEGCLMGRLMKSRRREEKTVQQGDKCYRAIVDPLLDDSGNLIGAVHTMADITEQKRLEQLTKLAEQELAEQQVLQVHADRLRSLGEMAAGIAHELNQPLVGVRGLAEHLLLGMERGWDLPPEKMREKLSLVVEQSDRMSHIIEHVRVFAREAGKPERCPTQVNDVINSAIGMLGTQLRSHGVTLATELADGLPTVSANPFSLEEVVLNLISNARDAVEQRMQGSPVVRRSPDLAQHQLCAGLPTPHNARPQVSETAAVVPASSDPARDSTEVARTSPDLAQDVTEGLKANKSTGDLPSAPRRGQRPAPSDPDEQPDILIHTQISRTGKDKKLELRVVDSGDGISEDVLDRVFEPFFTTKAPGQGTGLGLSICKSIVEQFDGTIEIASDTGKGTTVVVSLPANGEIRNSKPEIRNKSQT